MNNLKIKISMLALLILISGACKKKVLIEVPDPLFQDIQNSTYAGGSATVKYKLSNQMFTETGAILSAKRIDLENKTNLIKAKGIIDGVDYKVMFTTLSPNTIYWYQLYYINKNGESIYGPITELNTPAITLSYPPGFNKTIYQNNLTLTLEGMNLDLNLANYVLKIAQLDFKAIAVSRGDGSNGRDKITFDLGNYLSLNKSLSIAVQYKGITVFSDQIEVLGNTSDEIIIFKDSIVANLPTAGGINVVYQDKIYNMNEKITSVDPNTGVINFVANSIYQGIVTTTDAALTFNGEVYFIPILDFTLGYYVCRVYKFSTNTWRVIKLIPRYNANHVEYNINSPSFAVHQNKLYLTFKQDLELNANMQNEPLNRLQVYDQNTDSFTTVFNFDTQYNSVKLMSTGDKFYMLSNIPLYDGIFRYAFTSALSEVDLGVKELKLVKIFGEGNDAATPKQYHFFSLKGRIFTYGLNGLLEYNLQTNKTINYMQTLSSGMPGEYSNICIINNNIYICGGLSFTSIKKLSIE